MSSAAEPGREFQNYHHKEEQKTDGGQYEYHDGGAVQKPVEADPAAAVGPAEADSKSAPQVRYELM